MKKSILAFIAIIVVVALVACLGYCSELSSKNETEIYENLVPIKDKLVPIKDKSDTETCSVRYTLPDCHVVELADNVITVEDSNGNLWEFECEDYILGEVLILNMDTNGTDENIRDDFIIAVGK